MYTEERVDARQPEWDTHVLSGTAEGGGAVPLGHPGTAKGHPHPSLQKGDHGAVHSSAHSMYLFTLPLNAEQ